jgi:UDP-glucose 4-epimerase
MKICILGRNGFLGSEIAKRYPKYDVIPSKDTEIIFYFGAPSSIMLFNKNIGYCIRETINSFIELLDLCKETGAYLVYPSSATVYNKNNSYARCKAILEELHLAYGIPALGLRISACYGPREEHKGEYASIIYQWCKTMSKGKRPIIWGDGTQTRDFIYIDDVIDGIMQLVSEKRTGIVDMGTGINTSFNEVVDMINIVCGSHLKPKYIKAPMHYIKDTPVQPFLYKTELIDGISKCLNHE